MEPFKRFLLWSMLLDMAISVFPIAVSLPVLHEKNGRIASESDPANKRQSRG